MTANFACSHSRSTTSSSSRRSTMASQPSVYNEERNLLRLRAWEQRNQDTNQAKGLNHENVPLFGEPYKVNKGDELANRIQRMLGSYEDVNSSSPLTVEPLPIPGSVTAAQSDQCQPNTDKSTKAPFHHQVHYMSTSNPTCSSYSSESVTVSAARSPHHHGHPSTSSKVSLNQGQDGRTGNSAQQQQKKTEVSSDVMSDDKPQQLPHSHNNDMDTRDTSARHRESSDYPSDSVDVLALNTNLSPKESSLTQGTKTLPSQTFPPLLPSKQPSVVMTQKPTAYVRPMDGQDQVISDSPELKPSPEPYAPLPEIINKSQPGKMKTLPPLLTKTNEALCVEDILREMTHAWPPLLTALHTPSVEAPSKSPFSAKEAERVPSCPAQNPSQVGQHSSLSSSENAHSSGVETASSSDSDSSSRSESDSESTTGEPSEPLVNSSVKPQAGAPAVSNDVWQLSQFIRFNQQNPNTVHVSESTAHTPLPSTPSSKHSSAEVLGSCRDSKPQLSNLQTEPVDDLNKPQQHSQSHENSCHQNSSHNCPSLELRKPTCKTHTKPAKEDCTDHGEAAVSVRREETSVTKDKDKDPGLTDRPKVKIKTKHCRKSNEKDSKKESKRTTKHTASNKPKAGSELDVKLGPQSGCTSCGKTYPDLCSCPSQSLTQSDHLSLQPPVKINKPKEEKTSRKDSKKPHKTAHSQPGKSKGVVKPPQLLVVKIDLSLLSRVPRASGDLQDANSNAKKKAVVVKPKGTQNLNKKSSKVEADGKPHHGKKRRLEENINSPAHVSAKLQSCSGETEDRGRKKAKTNPATSTHKETAPEPKSKKRSSVETRDLSKEKVKRIDSGQHKKRSGKRPGNPDSEKSLKGSLNTSSSQSNKEASTSRPMLKFEDRQYPVKHYVKEAKKLKHKADAESDKLSKAFNYVEAAMFFVESGIAMEKDPQISMSSYTMFADTVDLLKFVLKLKSSSDSSAPPSERDFIALCLKCQSLLQMAMFRHKYKTALKYSKTLAEHFTTSHQTSVSTTKFAVTPSPMADMPSPANASSSSGPGSNHSGGGSGVGSTVVPQGVEQVMFNYINITTLFLGAHEMWEQAEAMAQRGSGLLSLLDSSLGPLTLTSSMNTVVRYMRQGIHWLRLDSQAKR